MTSDEDEDEVEVEEVVKISGKLGMEVTLESKASREAQNKPAREEARDLHLVRRFEGIDEGFEL